MWLAENNPEQYYWIINNLTITQIHHMFECKIWNLNEQTDKGRQKNNKKRMENDVVKSHYDKKFNELDAILKKTKEDGRSNTPA